MCATRKYILSKEATALITSEHLKMMVIPICLENSLRRGREAAVALSKTSRAPSGPRAPSPTCSVTGKVAKLTFQVVGFGNPDFELVSSMILRISMCGKPWPNPEGECSFGSLVGQGGHGVEQPQSASPRSPNHTHTLSRQSQASVSGRGAPSHPNLLESHFLLLVTWGP